MTTDRTILQDLFDRSLAFIAAHGRSTDENSCKYLGLGGRRCAVGALFTPEAKALAHTLMLDGYGVTMGDIAVHDGAWKPAAQGRNSPDIDIDLGIKALCRVLTKAGIPATTEVRDLLDRLQQAHDQIGIRNKIAEWSDDEKTRRAVEGMKGVGRTLGLDVPA